MRTRSQDVNTRTQPQKPMLPDSASSSECSDSATVSDVANDVIKPMMQLKSKLISVEILLMTARCFYSNEDTLGITDFEDENILSS